MLNTPGKEMDLLRVTVKVPGKRPPRAVPTGGPPAGLNGRVKDVLGSEGVNPGPGFFNLFLFIFYFIGFWDIQVLVLNSSFGTLLMLKV